MRSSKTNKFRAVLAVAIILSLLVIAVIGGSCAPKAQETYNWRISQYFPEDSSLGRACEAFCEEVQNESGGRIKITLYSGGALGDWVEVYEQVMRGTIEFAASPLSTAYDPRVEVSLAPYLFLSYEEMIKGAEVGGWLHELFNGIFEEQNLKSLTPFAVTLGGLTLNEPVKTIEEARGIKVRVAAMPVEAEKIEALGYTYTTIPFAEVYTALQTGIVEGQFGGGPFQAWLFRDVQKYYIDYQITADMEHLIINKDLWDSLSEEDQGVLSRAAENFNDLMAEYCLEEDTLYKQKLSDYGIEIIEFTPEEKTELAKTVRDICWPKMEERVGNVIMDKLRAHATRL